jgi:hypothetical protein
VGVFLSATLSRGAEEGAVFHVLICYEMFYHTRPIQMQGFSLAFPSVARCFHYGLHALFSKGETCTNVLQFS